MGIDSNLDVNGELKESSLAGEVWGAGGWRREGMVISLVFRDYLVILLWFWVRGDILMMI